ncbi:COG4648 family protein [Aliidiomarina indica]|uniref:COG4648 family protein n=1 Tax=Aliidiomarina indica TaxID=2749147 RepID=UPI001E3F0DF5|nr:hypothetical protein [Aliidiomarina indica]
MALVPLILILALRGFFTSRQSGPTRTFYLLTAIVLAIALSFREDERALLFYPVWINLGMLALFAWSLLRPPTVIARIARFMEGELDPKGLAYTTRVTQVWCGFFIINGGIALFTAVYGNWDLWVLYNGMLSYALMGLLMFVEWRVRIRVKASQ